MGYMHSINDAIKVTLFDVIGMAMSPTPLMGSLSDAHMSGRKRYASRAVVEKTVERWQKIMIKNMESAARSRARKHLAAATYSALVDEVATTTVVATSSTKAEYVAAASCCAQVLWIQNQLLDYG
nr:abscisic acid-insensitive 5-like protein 2 [Tanacetum cinerariifolium]